MKKKHYFSLLNPRNLEKEVHVYGYSFSWKTHLMVTVCSLLGISAVGIVFQLHPANFAIVLAAVILALPFFVVSSYRRMYEQKRFADVTTYMEQMLYSFQKHGKAVAALRETREIFDSGQMGSLIDEAVAYISSGRNTDGGVLREALAMIGEAYACPKIHAVHELVAGSEEYGGDMDDSIQLLLGDIELWKRRGYHLQAEKKTAHTDNAISIIIATVLCAAALYVLDGMGRLFPEGAMEPGYVFGTGIIQTTSLLFILAMVFVLAKSQRGLAADWLRTEQPERGKYLMESYRAVREYDEEKGKRKSLLYAAPFLVGAVAAFFLHVTWAGVAALAVGGFMLMQHRTGYRLALKDVNEALYLALPQWLMDMALLLQNNNVQVSIAKSVGDAPEILRQELAELMGRLERAPDSLKSYTDFCRDFDVPEAQTCMKMLHAISESGTGNAKVQIANLVQRVQEMQNMADEIRNRSTAFKAKLLFSYPVFAATVKLLIDLSFGMVLMMGMLGMMGGAG